MIQEKILDLSNLPLYYIKLLNEISGGIQDEYNSLIEGLLINKDNFEFILHPLLRRNPYHSNLFIHCCYLSFIKKLIVDNSLPEILIVPDYSLKLIIDNYIKDNSVNLKTVLPSNYKSKKSILKYKSLIRNILISIIYFVNKNSKRKKKISHINKPLTLIDSFFIASMFRSGSFVDRYYNGLQSVLSESEKEHVYFVPTILGDIFNEIGFRNAIRISSKSSEKFLFVFDHLNLIDYAWALLSLFRARKVHFTNVTFQGFNLSSYLNLEYRIGIFDTTTFTSLLNYRLIRRLKLNGINIRHFIDWFENQPIDKVYSKAMRKYYPNSSVFGYAGYYVSMKYNFFIIPTEFEIASQTIPDQIFVVGPIAINAFIKIHNVIPINTAPAFRFINNSTQLSAKKNISNIVLVCLPIDHESAKSILILIELIATQTSKLGINYIIQFHPSLDKTLLKEILDRLKFDNISTTNLSFRDAISYSAPKIVITNTSSTSVESLSLGIFVIIVGSTVGLTQNPIPDSLDKSIWSLVFTQEDIIESLKNFISSSNFPTTINKSDFFEPLTRHGVLKLLNLNNSN
jgi:hypothetical protein